MGDSWTHAICASCWNERNPDRPAPAGLSRADPDVCAWHGGPTMSGIYLRADPATVPYPQNRWGDDED